MATLKALKATVTGVRFRDEASLFTVLTATPLNGGATVSITGEMEDVPEIGEAVEAFGVFVTNKKYPGLSFQATAVNKTVGSSAYQVMRYLINIAKFLGDIKARDIADHFGKDIETVLEEDYMRLTEVEGIGEGIATNIKKAWDDNRGTRSVRIFLMKLGLKEYRIKNILQKHGAELEEQIRKDPFILMDDGLGFTVCDSLCEKLEVSLTDPCRIRGYIRELLDKSIAEEGNLSLPYSRVEREVNMFNADSNRPFNRDGVDPDLVKECLHTLIDQCLVKWDEELDEVYSLSSFFFESRSAYLLGKIMNAPSGKGFSDIDVDSYIADYEAAWSKKIEGFKLSDQQIQAVKSFVDKKVMVVTGAPGTGKTTIVKLFVGLMDKARVGYSLMAPTGVASKRLATASGAEASTLHKKLGYKGSSWDMNEYTKLSTDCVIVDEVSMLDQEVFYRLVAALPPHAKIVLVGDVDQLPSVGAGQVLKQIIQSGAVETVALNQVHRQSETSPIVRASHEIKNGDTSLSNFEINSLASKASIFNLQRDIDKAEETVVTLCKKMHDNGIPGYFQVLSPRNTGPLSVQSLNLLLQKHLNPNDPSKTTSLAIDKETSIFVDDRVIVTKNDYDIGVYNGDIGTVVSIDLKSVVVRLDSPSFGVTTISIPKHKARDIVKLGYCLTVHKSQGSEYKVVIMCLISKHGRNLLQRNLVYTGLTRAKDRVIIIGSSDSLQDAIINDKQQQRNSALASRLNFYKDNPDAKEWSDSILHELKSEYQDRFKAMLMSLKGLNIGKPGQSMKEVITEE